MSGSNTSVRFDFLSYVGLGLLALCFGSAFYFTALALSGFSVLATGAARIVVAAMFLVPLSYATGDGLPRTATGWIWSTWIGLVAWVLPFVLLVWAQTRIPTNIIGAYFATIPLMILLLSWIFLKQHVSRRKWFGLIVGSAGLVLLAGPGTFSQIGSKSEFLAQIAVFLATLGFAAGAIIIRLMPSPSAMQATAGAAAASAILALPILAFALQGAKYGVVPIVGILGVGVVSTGIGQFLRFFLIRRRGPIFIVPNGYLTAIVSAILGWALLGENPSLSAIIAFATIVTGLLIASDGTGRMKQV